MYNYRCFIQEYYRYLLFGLILTFCSCLGQIFFISFFGGDFRGYLKLTHGELGWVYSLTTLMSGFCLLWLGPKIDNYRVNVFTIVVFIILVLSMCLIGQTGDLVSFFLVLFCIRFCAQAILGHVAMTTIARVFSQNRGKAIGIISVGFSLGEAILPLSIVTLRVDYPWQTVWQILAGILAVIIFPVLILLMRNIQCEKNKKNRLSLEKNEIRYHDSAWRRTEVLKDPTFYLLLPALLAPTLILTGIFFSHIPLAIEKNWDLILLARCFVIFALSNLFGGLYFGKKVDEHGCFSIMPYILALLILGIFSLAFVLAPVFSIGFYMVGAGMAVGGNRVLLNTIWVELYGVTHLGEIRGMVVFICILCAGMSPSLFGWLLDNGVSMQTILAMCCVYIMMSMLILKKINFYKKSEEIQV